MVFPPERIHFECSRDVVDYISKGGTPSRNRFERVMAFANNPDVEQTPDRHGRVITCNPGFMGQMDMDTFNAVCRRFYENQRKNEIKWSIVSISLALTTFSLGLTIGEACAHK